MTRLRSNMKSASMLAGARAAYAARSFLPPAVRAVAAARVRRQVNGGRSGLLRTAVAMQTSRLDLLPIHYPLASGLVVDVGANVGDWTAAVRRIAPGAEVLAIEPNADAFESLARRYADDTRTTLINAAAGAVAGQSVLFRTEASHNSSLNRPRADAEDAFGWGWKVMDEVSVPVVTLDEALPSGPVSLLKIDVQGHEESVLRGAQRVLGRTGAVLLEVTMQRHYEGDTPFLALDQQMRHLGFELSALSRPDLSSDGRLRWFDACYLASHVAGDPLGVITRYGRGLGS